MTLDRRYENDQGSLRFLVAFLEGDALLAVFKKNDTAPLKAGACKRALHRDIVSVGVDLEIGEAPKAFGKAEACDAPSVRIIGNGNAMNHGIGLVV